jgi:hypothetical protein
MSLISLVLAAVTLALTGFAWLDARRRHQAFADIRTDIARQRVDRQERARFVASRTGLADTGDMTTAVVTMPTAVTRFSHDAIAAIPFTVLESIPATAETSKVVREIHDEISHAVYDAISGTTRGIAGFLRRGLSGRAQPRADQAGQAAQPDDSDPDDSDPDDIDTHTEDR